MKHQNAKHNFSRHIPFNCAFFHNYCILTNHLLSVHSTAQKNWIQLLKKVLSKPASEQSWLTRGMSRVTPATTSLRKAYERRALPTQGSESITREATHGALHIFPSFLVSSCSCHSFSSSHSCVSLFLQCCINIRSVPSLYHILRWIQETRKVPIVSVLWKHKHNPAVQQVLKFCLFDLIWETLHEKIEELLDSYTQPNISV